MVASTNGSVIGNTACNKTKVVLWETRLQGHRGSGLQTTNQSQLVKVTGKLALDGSSD